MCARASFLGGDKGIRTPDLCSAIAALYQLSYIPTRGRGVYLAGFSGYGDHAAAPGEGGAFPDQAGLFSQQPNQQSV